LFTKSYEGIDVIGIEVTPGSGTASCRSRPFPQPRLCIHEIPTYNGFMKPFHFPSIAIRTIWIAAAANAAWIAMANPEANGSHEPANSLPPLFATIFCEGAA
jgi:hypothetical protein